MRRRFPHTPPTETPIKEKVVQMSNEKHRPLGAIKRYELPPDRIAWHRGSYLDLVRRVRRWTAKQAARGRAGIREDSPYFMRWIADERTLRVAWDYLSRHGGQAPGIDGWRYCDFPETQIWPSLRQERDKIRSGT
jgi:hypothetical protein